MYYNENKIDKNEVIVNAVLTPFTISRNRANKFSNHSRTVINFHKYGNIGIIDLDIDITLKNKDGIAYDLTTTIFMVVYGVSGHQNDIDSRVWDRVYLIQNNAVLFEATIDMNNKQIKNLADGAEDGDAVNVSPLINMTTTANTEISKVNTNLQKSISNLKKQINNQINNAIAEYGFVNYLICVFYLDNNEFNNGEKISTLCDKKIALPSYDAIQTVESRKPTADDDLNFSYMNYRAQQCLTVNYNLNGKNNKCLHRI